MPVRSSERRRSSTSASQQRQKLQMDSGTASAEGRAHGALNRSAFLVAGCKRKICTQAFKNTPESWGCCSAERACEPARQQC